MFMWRHLGNIHNSLSNKYVFKVSIKVKNKIKQIRNETLITKSENSNEKQNKNLIIYVLLYNWSKSLPAATATIKKCSLFSIDDDDA